eukprot:CAMPEP_0203755306 /NCGR_PEP_ID=MMETSP0098-20131031/8770_1 /ASSEMBLY_ACC=CAM_ASM_000208 /TAXON_ID=96639 /ORGANISM=" , Strain NY0313808BC1" /LENGTH=364 /DNA_ID=CAMNT_0050646707 /DNA_START=9 /DNA_END=1100 /DNA_ORIENTATION=+
MKVVVGCYDGTLHGWDTDSKVDKSADSEADKLNAMQLVFAYEAHFSCTTTVAASRNWLKYNVAKNARNGASNTFLASGGSDEIIKVYDLGKLKEIGELVEHTDSILCLAFVGNKFLLSGGRDGKLCVWRCKDWNLVSELKGHKAGPVTSLAVHPTGKIALSTSKDNSIRMWNLENARPASRNRIKGYREFSHSMFSEDGLAYVVVGNDRDVLLFKVDDGKKGGACQTFKQNQRVNAISFEGGYLVIGLEDGKIACHKYSTETHEVDEEPKIVDCGFRVRGVSAHVGCDGKTFIVGALSTGQIVFWDLAEMKIVNKLQAGSSSHVTCMVCPDDRPLEDSVDETETASSNKRSERKPKPSNKRAKT